MAPSYGALLRRAAGLALRRPGLWVFGFFTSASAGGGTGDVLRIIEREEIDLGLLAPILSALLALLVLLGIFFLLASILAEGALIHAVREIESGRTTRIGDTTTAGLLVYGRLLAVFLMLLAALAVSLLPLIGAPLLVWKALGSGSLVTLLLVLALAPPYILFALGATYTFAWAPRVAVLDGAAPLAAVRAALRGLARDPMRAFALALGSIANEVIALTLLVFASLPLTVVAAGLYLVHPLLVILPGVPFVALLLAYFGAKGTFVSAYWTLAALASGRGSRGAPEGEPSWAEGAGGI